MGSFVLLLSGPESLWRVSLGNKTLFTLPGKRGSSVPSQGTQPMASVSFFSGVVLAVDLHGATVNMTVESIV